MAASCILITSTRPQYPQENDENVLCKTKCKKEILDNRLAIYPLENCRLRYINLKQKKAFT